MSEPDKLIYAWTDTSGYKYYPQYINLSVQVASNKMTGRPGLALVVRGPEHACNDGIGQGFTAQVMLPAEILLELAEAIRAYVRTSTPPDTERTTT